MNINNILSANNNPIEKNTNLNASQGTNGDFKKMLQDFVSDANKTDSNDKVSNMNLILGEASNTHEAMITAEKADLSLRLTIQIRNKIIDAYSEVMRMQI